MRTYSQKLLDPRWQRKRLEIMERDGWKCRHCLNDKKTLHVHHREYIKNREPWDYPDENFKTLCESCHEFEHGEKRDDEVMKILSDAIRSDASTQKFVVQLAWLAVMYKLLMYHHNNWETPKGEECFKKYLSLMEKSKRAREIVRLFLDNTEAIAKLEIDPSDDQEVEI